MEDLDLAAWVPGPDALPVIDLHDAITELHRWVGGPHHTVLLLLDATRLPLLAVLDPVPDLVYHPHRLRNPERDLVVPTFALRFDLGPVPEPACEDCLADYRSWRLHLAGNGVVALDWMQCDGERLRSLAITHDASAWGGGPPQPQLLDG